MIDSLQLRQVATWAQWSRAAYILDKAIIMYAERDLERQVSLDERRVARLSLVPRQRLLPIVLCQAIRAPSTHQAAERILKRTRIVGRSTREEELQCTGQYNMICPVAEAAPGSQRCRLCPCYRKMKKSNVNNETVKRVWVK